MKKIVLYILLNIFLLELLKELLKLDQLTYNKLTETLSFNQVEKILQFQKKINNWLYLVLPLLMIFKIFLISSVLYIGTFFYSKAKVTFKQLLNAVIKAEFVFLGVGVLKIIWFYFFQTNYALEDLQYFYPLSALNIVGYKGLESWFIYPLQVLNLFELAYCLLLSYFVGKLAFTEKDKGKPMDLGFKIVASSYGSALLLWVVVVMFFTLNYS